MTAGLSLPDALHLPVGRGTPLLPEQQQQLLGHDLTLTQQLTHLFDQTSSALRQALNVQADLPARRSHPWTLLTEGESPIWPLLALSQPPPIPAPHTTRLVRHLSTAHQAMPFSRARDWAAHSATSDPAGLLLAALTNDDLPSWSQLLSAIIAVQTQHLLLGYWGALSAFIGMNPALKVSAARQFWQAITVDPTLTAQPATLAQVALWAALTPLHGGWPRPPGSQVSTLAGQLKTLSQHTTTGTLPGTLELHDLLGQHLPVLSEQARTHPIHNLQAGRDPNGGDPSVGIPVIRQAGQTAYWLTLRQQLHFITCSAQSGQDVQLHAWNWTRPSQLV